MGTLGTRINPECEKETPVYSEELIQKVLRGGGALSFNSLKKLLDENNIEYEEMIKDYDALTFHKDNEE